MPALFPRWSNSALRLCIAAAALVGTLTIVLPMVYVRSPFATRELLAAEQPVAFDHRHHVEDDGIDCIYCHVDAERGRFAGVPATDICMGCHAQIWNESALLAPARTSALSQHPLAWNRVNDLGDFVYFDHSVHVRFGVPCARCHGATEAEARVFEAQGLTMDFCLDCHRHPSPLGTGKTARMTALTTCSACHR
jgi:hypothetical protein